MFRAVVFFSLVFRAIFISLAFRVVVFFSLAFRAIFFSLTFRDIFFSLVFRAVSFSSMSVSFASVLTVKASFHSGRHSDAVDLFLDVC